MTLPNPDTRTVVRQTGSITEVRYFFSGFTDLLVPVRQRYFRQLQSFCAVHSDPVRILEAGFFFSRGKKGRNQGHFLFSTIILLDPPPLA